MIFSLFYYLIFYYFLINSINKIKLNKNFDYKQKNSIKLIELKKIIGLESVKKELAYFMDFIKNNDKYKKWNVKLPRGILLVGPPGTGKTLLVKTLAKQINIPVIHTSGSEFVEKYVGVGASRVRSLFARARGLKKCIIFIDEIDAIGRSRENGDSNSERDSTLNQLLVEMDGFKEDNSIMIFGATNLVHNLDRALLRSGRFDKKVYFDPPNKEERDKIFRLYLKSIDKRDINYQKLAELASGLTGADIANVCNQAKINAIQQSYNYIIHSHIEKAIDEVMIGREKPERKMTLDELKRVAHHEAGHALLGYMIKYSEPPIKVSILPRGENALGFSQPKPMDIKLYTSNFIQAQICVLLGGRGAEKLFYNSFSSGAYDDIERATNLAQKYLLEWGMDEKMGPINYNLFYKKNIPPEIFVVFKNLIQKLETFTQNLLDKNKIHLEKLAGELLEKETIIYDDIIRILPKELKDSIDNFDS
jgi:AFG3 family protein